jgi:16S rRNA (guanine527-N7)-methyltransferase
MKARPEGDAAPRPVPDRAAVAAAVERALAAHLPGRLGDPWHGLPESLTAELARWCAALAAAHARINLTGITAPEDMAVRHVLDSLAALSCLPPPSDPPLALLDLGSGGGAPGLPLALARPDLTVFLAESRGRKAAALADIVAELELAGRVTVVAQRGEIWLAGHAADVVVTRAVGSLVQQLELLAPLRPRFGRLVALKGPAGDDELAAARPRLARLGFAEPERHALELPGGAGRRVLFVFAGGRRPGRDSRVGRFSRPG